MRYPHLIYFLRLHGIRDYALAGKLGLSESRLSRLLNGRLEFSEEERARVIAALADLGLAVESAWLFEVPIPPRPRGDLALPSSGGMRILAGQ